MPAGNVFRHGRLFRSKPFTLFFLSVLFLPLRPVSAVPRNITMDDQKGDGKTIPVYTPAVGAWNDQTCGGCAIQPDPAKLFENTAMGATFKPERFSSNTVDFDFTGTAIYIFFTLFYNEGDQVTVNTECHFTLDNEPPVFFNHTGDPTIPPKTKRDYQALVFSKAGLESVPHHMKISMSDVPYHVFLSFDFAQYTIDDAPNLPQSSSNSATATTNPAGLPQTSSSSTATATGSVRSSQISSSGTGTATDISRLSQVSFDGSATVTNTARLSQTSDSLLTTSTSPSSSNKSSPSAGIIAGGVVGGLAVLTGFVILLYFYRRDTKRYRSPSSPDPTIPRPFAIEMHSNNKDRQTESSSRSGIRPFTTPASLENSSQTQNSPARQNTDAPMSSSASADSRSRSRSPGQGSVEYRIRAANQRMRSLRAEMASVSGRTASSSRSSNSKTSSSRATEELAEEVRRLRQEIEALKQLQTQQLRAAVANEPPPRYTDD